MSIYIRPPLWFSEIGQKDNQEDFVMPTDAKTDALFYVMELEDGRKENWQVRFSPLYYMSVVQKCY